MINNEKSKSIPIIVCRENYPSPTWATLQRQLLETLEQAALEFVKRYTRPDGTLVWRDEWPGMDGSDDPYEGFQYLPLLYLLGAGEEILHLSRKLWEAITLQWTHYGQLYREFDAYYDWMHHGEGYVYTYFLGLADPYYLKNRQRAIRFASFYTGEDAEVQNYDPKLKLMRSPITGSRGPRFEMTAEDWSTHREVLNNYGLPFEDIPGLADLKNPWLDDKAFQKLIYYINKRMAKGDVPINLTATSLLTNAYLYTGKERYREWVLEYLKAWEERTRRNNGIMPDNVGLNDQIGEYIDGKWWGGYYGWHWPHGAFNILEALTIAGCNATLIDGDASHLNLVRSQLDLLMSLGRKQDGQWVVPHRRTDDGWTDYYPLNPLYPIYCWAISREEQDLARVEALAKYQNWQRPTTKVGKGFIGNTTAWFNYIQGNNSEYPEQILQINLELVQEQLEKIRAEQGDPAFWDIHHWQLMTPIICEGLVQLTLGAPMYIYHGGLLHTKVRYYDAIKQRAGLPDAVAALVEKFDSKVITLILVNLSPTEERSVIVQAGSFGEHCFIRAKVLNFSGEVTESISIESKWLQISLASKAGIRLELETRFYANQPSYEPPW